MLISSCTDHQSSSSTHGAKGSTEPLGPMGNIGVGENKASAAILSQDARGLMFHPHNSFTLRNTAQRSDFTAFSEIDPRWGPP